MPSIQTLSVRLALVLEGLPNLLEDEGHCATGTGIAQFGARPVDKQLRSLRSHPLPRLRRNRQQAEDGRCRRATNCILWMEKRS